MSHRRILIPILLLALGTTGALSGQTAAVESSAAAPGQATEAAAPAPAEIPSDVEASPGEAAGSSSEAMPDPVSGSETPTVGEAAGAPTGGPTAAVGETAAALRGGTEYVARESRGLWSSVFVPMWQRFATGLPSVLKALVVLLAFWLAAIVLSASVRKLLSLTKIDDKVARDWGLAGLLKTKDGKTRAVENVAGSAVKWLVLLFGFVAFFQALDLSMVAGPLQGIVDRIVGVVPNLLQATVILAVYWILASMLRMASRRGLAAAGFDERASRFISDREIDGEVVRPSGLVARFLFYLVLIFGLVPFLDALGQRSLVAPLSSMLEKILGVLPNLIGAALIFFIGHLIASILREVVTNFLAATGTDGAIRRMGLGEAVDKLKVSEIAGSITYFFVIIPVIAAAVEGLGIRAISEPVTRTLETLLSAVPLVFVAVVVFGVGYFLAKIVRRIVQSFLQAVGFDALPERLGLDFLASKDARHAPSAIAGAVVMLIIVLLTAQQALATLNLSELAALIGRLIAYLPQVLVGLVILVAAWALANYSSRLVTAAMGERPQLPLLAPVARYAILAFGASLALIELGIGERLLAIAVAAILGGLALALGLAFGLGGQSRAKQLIEETERR